MIRVFGDTTGMAIFEELKEKGYSHTVLKSIHSYYFNYWNNNGILFISNFLSYVAKRSYLSFFNPRNIIIFLGVDGAGKTTLINYIKTNYASITPQFKHCHLLPALPFNSERNSMIVNSHPHRHPSRSNIITSAKIAYYLLRYWLSFLWPCKTSVLYFFDRHIADLYVDPKRFRSRFINLPLSVLKLFPPVDASLLISVTNETAQIRKPEVSINETMRQNNAYKKIIDVLPNSFVLNGELPIHTNAAIAMDFISQSLDKKLSAYADK